MGEQEMATFKKLKPVDQLENIISNVCVSRAKVAMVNDKVDILIDAIERLEMRLTTQHHNRNVFEMECERLRTKVEKLETQLEDSNKQ